MFCKQLLFKYTLLSVLFYLSTLICKSDNDIYFYHLGPKDGISQINIMSIYQDEFGAMWFGTTEGLNRYNGQEIESFKPTEKRVGLTRNIIYTICGNKKGSLYIRAENDLVHYDLISQKFECLKQGGVDAIKYKNDILWVVINNKIMQYDEKEKEFKQYTQLGDSIHGVTSIYPSTNGKIWVGTKYGLVVISPNNSNREDYIIDKQFINSIYEDKSNNIWVGTYLDGAYKIDTSGKITNYRHQIGQKSLSNNQVRDIVEDNQGKIWIATFYGLNEYNPQTNEWKKYTNIDNVPYSISHSSVYALCKDKQSTIWAGTYFGGVNYFNTEVDIFRFYGASTSNINSLSFPYVANMTEDRYNNLWICTEGGALNCLNLKNRSFSRYTFNSNNAETRGQYNQKTIWYRKDKDLLYIGLHNGGLAIFNIKDKSSRIIIQDTSKPYSLINNTINKMQFYDNKLILLTQSGLVKMDIDKEQFLPISDNPHVNKTLQDIGRHVFYIDKKKRLWVTKPDGVLIQIDLITNRIKRYNSDELKEKSISRFTITDIFENHLGELFFATTGAGIFKYNEETSDFDNYTEEKNGLLSNYCYSISESSTGYLILLHNKGVSFFDPQNPDKLLFRSSPNFPITGFNIGNSTFLTSSDEIFIGGINGLVSFYEKDLNKVKKDYSIYFDKLYINNIPVYPDDKSGVLKQALPLLSEVELKYSQNNFSVEFATSNFLQSMTLNYEYKLEGFDDNWIQANTQIISYTNLSPGNYRLHVRETVTHDKENTNKVYTLNIKIKSPFYLSPFAFILYAVLVCLTIVGIIRFYIWRTKLETSLELERKEKEHIKELNQTKLRFFMNVSHEFRTPLTLIIGQVESLLMQNDLNSKVYNKIAKIHKNTNHLLTLISELLDFRKHEQGYYKLNIKHVELIQYVKDIYESFQEYASKRNIKYKLEYTEEHIFVYIDPGQMQKAIYNLLSNAFKYTSEGGEIKIKIKIQDYDVLVQIIDTGIGIPQESLTKIFERFYQVEYRSSGFTLGTGIGLALTREIILNHKGDIHVESTVNEGSIFSINLHLGTSHFSKDEINSNDLSQTYNSNAIPHVIELDIDDEEYFLEQELIENEEKPTIMIVDDNESLLEMLMESFSNYYNVYTAINGKNALDMILKIQPDIVVSDITMPEMSGKELCFRIKNNINTSHIPVVLLTAQTADSQIIDGFAFGADAYVTKPFNIKVLITHCNNLIKNRQLLYQKFASQVQEPILFNSITDSDNILIEKTISIIKENFGNPDFDMNKLGLELGMGRTKLYMRIKEITGFTPNEFTLNLKLQEAVNLLDSKQDMNISDIAFHLGFSSTKYFSKCFKTFYGIVPQDWRKKGKAEVNNS